MRLREAKAVCKRTDCLISFFFLSYGDHRDLHSFPTRRSSDLFADWGRLDRVDRDVLRPARSEHECGVLDVLLRRDAEARHVEQPAAHMQRRVQLELRSSPLCRLARRTLAEDVEEAE